MKTLTLNTLKSLSVTLVVFISSCGYELLESESVEDEKEQTVQVEAAQETEASNDLDRHEKTPMDDVVNELALLEGVDLADDIIIISPDEAVASGQGYSQLLTQICIESYTSSSGEVKQSCFSERTTEQTCAKADVVMQSEATRTEIDIQKRQVIVYSGMFTTHFGYRYSASEDRFERSRNGLVQWLRIEQKIGLGGACALPVSLEDQIASAKALIDLNSDGILNSAEIFIAVRKLGPAVGTSNKDYDFDRSGIVDNKDVSVFMKARQGHADSVDAIAKSAAFERTDRNYDADISGKEYVEVMNALEAAQGSSEGDERFDESVDFNGNKYIFSDAMSLQSALYELKGDAEVRCLHAYYRADADKSTELSEAEIESIKERLSQSVGTFAGQAGYDFQLDVNQDRAVTEGDRWIFEAMIQNQCAK